MRYFHGYLIQKCSEASLCLNDGENFSRSRRCARQYTAGYERPAVSCPSGRNRCPVGLMAVGLGGLFAPKGLQDSARGFNPGKRPMKRSALEGRKLI
jgi:hypothetical protein